MEPSDGTPRGELRRRARVSFLAHEIADYLLGVLLVVLGIHDSPPMSYALMVAGLALCVLGVLTNGPLGMTKVLSRRAHALGDGLVAAGLALSPLIAGHHLDMLGVAVAEIMALVLLWVSWSTSYAPPARSKPALAGGAPKAGAVAPGTSLAAGKGVTPAAVAADSAPRQEPSPTDRLARAAGRGVRTARDGAKALEPRVGHATNVGARRLGMAVGSVRRARARTAGAAGGSGSNGKSPQQSGGSPG
jgi:hypothetical protein